MATQSVRCHSVQVQSDLEGKYNTQRLHEIVHLQQYPPPARTCSKQGVNALEPLTTWQVNPIQWGNQRAIQPKLSNHHPEHVNNDQPTLFNKGNRPTHLNYMECD